MNLNTITLDQPAGPKASNAPRGGDGSFQVAYAKVLGESHAPVAREGARRTSRRKRSTGER